MPQCYRNAVVCILMTIVSTYTLMQSLVCIATSLLFRAICKILTSLETTICLYDNKSTRCRTGVEVVAEDRSTFKLIKLTLLLNTDLKSVRPNNKVYF